MKKNILIVVLLVALATSIGILSNEVSEKNSEINETEGNITELETRLEEEEKSSSYWENHSKEQREEIFAVLEAIDWIGKPIQLGNRTVVYGAPAVNIVMGTGEVTVPD